MLFILDQKMSFMGTVVNRTFPSLYGGLLDITRTVPLM